MEYRGGPRVLRLTHAGVVPARPCLPPPLAADLFAALVAAPTPSLALSLALERAGEGSSARLPLLCRWLEST
jgi:hypothetical protein